MSATFRGFLLNYCKELTNSDTTSLKKLFTLADSEYPRAYEPLLLLAICDGREDYLLKQAKDSPISETYTRFLVDLGKGKKALVDHLSSLEEGDRFRRPLIAWQAEMNRLEDDRRVLKQVSVRLGELINEKGMTRAQACKLANVNKGNFYAFLKGDPSKLGRNTAMRIYRQIETA